MSRVRSEVCKDAELVTVTWHPTNKNS